MTVVDLRRRKLETIKEITDEVRRQFAETITSDHKAYRARLYAGQLLNELKRRLDAGEMAPATSWWKWYADQGFVRGRRDAEKVMQMARAEDPEAAHEEEKKATRERVAKSRAKKKDTAYVRRNNSEENQEDDEFDILTVEDPIEHLLRLVEQLDEGMRKRFIAEIRRRYG